MHISYKPLWHTLLERDMRKEDLRLAAGMTTNMIANMSKEGKHISMDTLARICETLNCEITNGLTMRNRGVHAFCLWLPNGYGLHPTSLFRTADGSDHPKLAERAGGYRADFRFA